jgi:hypothetical protein
VFITSLENLSFKLHSKTDLKIGFEKRNKNQKKKREKNKGRNPLSLPGPQPTSLPLSFLPGMAQFGPAETHLSPYFSPGGFSQNVHRPPHTEAARCPGAGRSIPGRAKIAAAAPRRPYIAVPPPP